ncbi:outer membrane protein transport protein [Zoogloea sp.]|uniref:OmpP1/FadL family transporter n=1 Tax=Zoogloea sp. TaxID=49181 RepID=UPI00263357CF|nr:outer membrane protein transport protein [Zoogloea sp.]MDD3354956.1 outer membrane protein transport protein [Zoogloea sp.]
MKLQKLSVLALALASLGQPLSAYATNGYFTHGYGVRSQGVAGVGIALPQDGLAAASNPAGTALVGDRLDLGLTYFKPDRGTRFRSGAGTTELSANDTTSFLIPELGYTRQISPFLGVGLAIYGNGGMNTDYAVNPFGAPGRAGIDMAQLFVTPSVAYRVHENHTLGLGVTYAHQRFEARGIGGFAGMSSAPGALSDRGHDSGSGWGIKLGWTGQVLPTLRLGVNWSSRIEMDRFDKYRGLFAEGGGFDIPANYGLGLAWQALPALTLAADWQRIEFGSVRSVGNHINAGGPLGAANGSGFGWNNISVVKLGAIYAYDQRLTLRAGVSRAQQAVPASETFFNILAPGVVRNHYSLGASYRIQGGELSAAYTYVPEVTVSGNTPVQPGGPYADLHMRQNILAVGYSWLF